MKTRRAVSIWLPPIAWMAVIFIFSSFPNLATGLPTFWDQLARVVAHIIEFLLLGVLLGRAFSAHSHNRRSALASALVLGVVWALFDEAHQYFVPGRVADLWDIAFDAVGVALGLVLFKHTPQRRTQK